MIVKLLGIRGAFWRFVNTQSYTYVQPRRRSRLATVAEYLPLQKIPCRLLIEPTTEA